MKKPAATLTSLTILVAANSLMLPSAYAKSTMSTNGVSTTGYVEAISATGGWIATQTEAEAGVINDHIMTPLRVKQSITANTAAGTIPSGAIMAFDLASCPSGWSEYTAARGRFLRGVDATGTDDPSGTRTVGSVQADSLQNLSGQVNIQAAVGEITATGVFSTTTITMARGAIAGSGPNVISFDASRMARTSSETRPKNVAVLFCRKN